MKIYVYKTNNAVREGATTTIDSAKQDIEAVHIWPNEISITTAEKFPDGSRMTHVYIFKQEPSMYERVN